MAQQEPNTILGQPMNTISKWLTALALLAGPVAQASGVFQGQDANGAFNNSCGNTCVMYYDSTLNITILGNWNIGYSDWPGAQALAETAGFSETGLTGWVLPTGNGNDVAGASNQYLSIWQAVGSSLSGLQAQFDGVQVSIYWSGTPIPPGGATVWKFNTNDNGSQNAFPAAYNAYAVAVRSGEISAVPFPASAWLLLSGLIGVGAISRRRRAP